MFLNLVINNSPQTFYSNSSVHLIVCFMFSLFNVVHLILHVLTPKMSLKSTQNKGKSLQCPQYCMTSSQLSKYHENKYLCIPSRYQTQIRFHNLNSVHTFLDQTITFAKILQTVWTANNVKSQLEYNSIKKYILLQQILTFYHVSSSQCKHHMDHPSENYMAETHTHHFIKSQTILKWESGSKYGTFSHLIWLKHQF